MTKLVCSGDFAQEELILSAFQNSWRSGGLRFDV
jgi:hypothetical protein